MKKQVIYFFLLLLLILVHNLHSQQIQNSGQELEVSELFLNQQILSIKLSYSVKDIRKNTNDSTYIETDLSYMEDDGSWNTLEVKIRRRGHNRLENCYFPPIKIKINKLVGAKTLFEGNKELKLVVPCLMEKDKNDNVVKEYMAYKLYELISPYHFKTRMVAFDFTEIKGKKTKFHKLKGIFIEDVEKVAERHNGHVLKRFVHPLEQDGICSIENAFFQYMIGNTDFSIAYQHNEKLLFVDKKAMPLPYDFDMSGLVNASYSVVSSVQGETLGITKVTNRLYRGFKRDEKIYQRVRKEFIDNKVKMLDIIDDFESLFDNPKEFARAKDFILDFFDDMINDEKFRNKILRKSRIK